MALLKKSTCNDQTEICIAMPVNVQLDSHDLIYRAPIH